MYNQCLMKADAFRLHDSQEEEVIQSTRSGRLTLVALVAMLLIAACAAFPLKSKSITRIARPVVRARTSSRSSERTSS